MKAILTRNFFWPMQILQSHSSFGSKNQMSEAKEEKTELRRSSKTEISLVRFYFMLKCIMLFKEEMEKFPFSAQNFREFRVALLNDSWFMRFSPFF